MSPKNRKRRPGAPAEERNAIGNGEAAIREDLLTALIAGTLSPGQRAEVARYLASNPEAREVLWMAYEAMMGERDQG